MENLKQILKKSGLDEKEIDLYLASLSLGEAGMSELAKRANMKRTTAYVIFKSLEEKGLLGSFKMRKGLRFVATNPDVLMVKIKNQLKDLESALPELKALSIKSGQKPKVTYYEGVEGYITAVEDSLKRPGITLRHIGSIAEGQKVMTEDYDLKSYMPRRIQNNIFLKSLYCFDTPEKIRGLDHTKQLREIRYLPKEYAVRTLTLIYENKVIITTSKKDLVTIVIENDEIAEAERQKFDLLWNLIGAKK